jgi:hypothetical protein
VVEDAAATRDAEFNGMTVPADHVHAAFMFALGFAYGKIVKTDEHLIIGARPSVSYEGGHLRSFLITPQKRSGSSMARCFLPHTRSPAAGANRAPL